MSSPSQVPTRSDVHPASDAAGLAGVDHAHRHARAALDDAATPSLVAVTWASAHLAAVARALHPVVERTLPDGRERVRGQRQVDRALQQALWELDRRLTGDVHLARVPVPVLEERVRETLTAHEQSEHGLVTALLARLDEAQVAALGEHLDACLLRGPTRPHPDTGQGRLTGAAGFWFGGVVDRVRDALDSRDVPTPHRVPVPRQVSRWGAYVMGLPFDSTRSGRR